MSVNVISQPTTSLLPASNQSVKVEIKPNYSSELPADVVVLGNVQQQAETASCECTSCIPQTPEKSSGKKFMDATKNGLKKTTKFMKNTKDFIVNNQSTIKGTAIGLVKGVYSACTVLGASQLLDNISQTSTKTFANKLALISAVGVTAVNILKSKKEDTSKAENIK